MTEGNTNFAILTEHIDSHSLELAHLCQRFFDGMPKMGEDETDKNVNTFRQYLHNFSFADDVFYQFIINCSLFGRYYPKESFFTFHKALPDINLESSSAPASPDSGRVFFTEHLENMNYRSPRMRAALKFFIGRCVSFFMSELLLRSTGDKLKSDGLIEIVKTVAADVFYRKCGRFALAYLTEALGSWAEPFRLISKAIPEEVISEAVTMLENKEITNIQRKLIILMFRSISVPDVQSVAPLVDIVAELYRTAAPETELHNLCGIFLLNIIRQVLEIDPNFQCNLIRDAATKFIGAGTRYPESAFQVVAVISKYQGELSMDGYLKMVIPGCKHAGKSVVAGIAAKVGSCEFEAATLVEWLNKNIAANDAKGDEVGDLIDAIWTRDPKILLEMLPRFKADFTVGILKGLRLIFEKGGSKSESFEGVMKWMEVLFVEMNEKRSEDRMSTEVFFETVSFTLGLRISVEDREETLAHLVKNLHRSSQCFYRHTLPDIVSIHEVVDCWLGYADLAFKDVFQITWKHDPKTVTKFSDPAQFVCLSSVPYLEPSDMILDFLVVSLFSKDSSCGALAMRTIQAVIHLHPNVAIPILERLRHCFDGGKLSEAAVAIAANAITFAIESAQYQKVELSKELITSLKCAAVLGFCTGYPSVRKRIGDCVTFRTDYVDHEEAKRKAVLAVAHMSVEEVKLLPTISFEQMIQSDTPFLYLFFTSSTRPGAIPNDIMSVAFKLITGFLEHNKTASNRTTSATCLSLVLSLDNSALNPGDLDAASMGILTEATEKVAEFCGSKEFGPFGGVFLCGMVSGLAELHQPFILPIFAKNNRMYQRVLAYALRESINQSKLHPLDKEGNVKPYISEVLDSTMSFFFSNDLVSRDVKSVMMSPVLLQYSDLHLIIDDFAIVLKYVFDQIALFWKDKSSYLTMQTFVDPVSHYSFSDEKWFVLLCNLSCHYDCTFSVSISIAFAAWLVLFPVPDKYFTAFLPKMIEISEMVPEITYPVFGRYAEHLITGFLNKRRFHIFHGIAAQLSYQSCKCLEMLPDALILKGNPTLSALYKNCGSLTVMALYHALSKQCERREIAVEFLTSLVVLAMLMKDDPTSAKIFLENVSLIREKMKSYTVFVNTVVVELNQMLSKLFAFCSEQFLWQIFRLLQVLAEGKAETTSSSVTDCLRSGNSCSLNSEGANCRSRGGSFPGVRSRSSLYSTSKIAGSASGRIKKVSHVQFDKIEKISGFIVDWLRPFTYNLQTMGISVQCEPQFRRFCLYSFINTLLNICSCVGMSEPFAVILDTVLAAAPEMMMLCILDIQKTKPELRQIAQVFMVYIYHSIPEKFTAFVYPFLRVTSWWFSEVQLMKNDEGIAGESFLDGNSGEPLLKNNPIREMIEDAGNFEATYFSSNVVFLMSIFLKLMRDRSDSLLSLQPQILIFSYLFNKPIGSLSDNLLCQITRTKVPDFRRRTSSFAAHTERADEERWKIVELLPFLEANETQNRYILEWAICCGDVVVAARALNLYHRLGCILPKDAIGSMIRSIQAVVSTLNERTAQENFERFNRVWFVKALGADAYKPCLRSYIQYLAYAMVVLLDYIQASKDYDERIYKLAVSYLKATSREYNEMFTVALNVLNEFAMYGTVDFVEVMPLLLGLQVDSVSALSLFFKVVYSLDKGREYDMERTADILCLLVLIPYVWDSDKSLLYDRFGKEKVDAPEFLESFTGSVLSHLSEDSLRLIMTFFSYAVRFGSPVQRMAVYLEACVLLQKMESPGRECSFLLYCVITDKENQAHAPLFIDLAMGRNIEVLLPAQIFTTKAQQFPEMNVVDLSPDTWEPSGEDVFASPETYPLLYLTDLAFVGSEVMMSVKRACEKVQVKPFTKWSEELFQAQLQNSTDVDPGAKMEIDIVPVKFGGKMEQALSIVLKRDESVTKEESTITETHKSEQENPFMLTDVEALELGQKLLDDCDLELTKLV